MGELWVTSQAVTGVTLSPTVAEPHKGLAPLIGPTGGLAACCAMPSGSIPATVAARTILALVPEAPDEFGAASLPLGVYTCSDHRTSFQLGLWSWPFGCWLGGSPGGPFSFLLYIIRHLCDICKTFYCYLYDLRLCYLCSAKGIRDTQKCLQ